MLLSGTVVYTLFLPHSCSPISSSVCRCFDHRPATTSKDAPGNDQCHDRWRPTDWRRGMDCKENKENDICKVVCLGRRFGEPCWAWNGQISSQMKSWLSWFKENKFVKWYDVAERSSWLDKNTELKFWCFWSASECGFESQSWYLTIVGPVFTRTDNYEFHFIWMLKKKNFTLDFFQKIK